MSFYVRWALRTCKSVS